MINQTVCVLGLGYIGLPTAALLATKGFTVNGCDISEGIVNKINQGQVHIVENDLDLLVKSAVGSALLTAHVTPQPSDIYILAVPTPFKDDHVPDLSYIKQATKSIAPLLKAGDLIILESTSPVGTTDKISQWLTELRKDLNIPLTDVGAVKNSPFGEQIYIAHCPERVLPGHIIRELVENDRIIGGIGKKSGEKAAQFYRSFVTGKVLVTNARTAELAKLTENAYRDVNIAFANELANICSDELINVKELIQLANHHPRVNILEPGIGVGGHCIAVDPWFIVDRAQQKAKLIHTAREINDARPAQVVKVVADKCAGYQSPRVLCLGLAYKPNIDDIRESPAMEIVEQLCLADIAQISVIEPNISKLPVKLAQLKVSKVMSSSECDEQNVAPTLVTVDHGLTQYDIAVLLVNHCEFDEPFLNQLRENTSLLTVIEF
ncbi:MAG: UDP-N-acetyl-D-mannosamine dehydrogenase [Coxiellaceae bacterium]|nr:UDP-N-acetyl-D-mannosamine dehydrogenase [Coxiellaceae bacterium]